MRRAVILLALSIMAVLVISCGNRTEPSPVPDATAPVSEATAPATEPVETAEIAEPSGEVDETALEGEPVATVEATAEVAEGAPADDPLGAVDPTGQSVLLWHPFTAEREAELNALAEAFNEANEYGITVSTESVGDVPTLSDRMKVAIAAGDLPGLVVAYPYQAAEFRAGDGAIVDLSPYIESAAWGYSDAERADFLAPAINSDFNAQVEEQLGFPLHRSVEVLYYNSTLLNELGFDSAPATWEEFEEMACAASAAEHTGYALALSTSTLASMVYSRGGELMAEGQEQYTLDSPAVVETLEFLQGLSEAGCLSLVTTAFGDQQQFAAGDVLFTMGSSSELLRYQAAVEEGYAGEWSVAPLPHSTEEPVLALYGPSLSVGSTTEEQQMAAWLFIKWLAEPEQQARWAQATGAFPVRNEAIPQLESLFLESPNYQIAYDLLQYGRGEPAVAGYEVVREILDETVLHVVQGSDIAETLSDINEEANTILEEFVP